MDDLVVISETVHMNKNVVEKFPKVPKQNFRKLSEARIYAQKYPDSSFLFSYEIGRGGQRQYLVTDLPQFWKFYEHLPVKHHYEVITSRSKLYFDLEFNLCQNQLKNGHFMTRRLITIVNKLLLSEYQRDVKCSDILILEASTEAKFSVHIIYTKKILLGYLDQ